MAGIQSSSDEEISLGYQVPKEERAPGRGRYCVRGGRGSNRGGQNNREGVESRRPTDQLRIGIKEGNIHLSERDDCGNRGRRGRGNFRERKRVSTNDELGGGGIKSKHDVGQQHQEARGRSERGRGSNRGRGSDRGKGGTRGAKSGERGEIGNKEGVTRSKHFHRLQLSDLTEIAKCTPENVVIKLQDDLKGFQTSLNSCNTVPEKIKAHYVQTILNLLLKVCEVRKASQDEGACMILAEFLSDRCSAFHMLLKLHISKVFLDEKQESSLLSIYKLFQFLLDSFPTSAWLPLPIDDLVAAVNDFSSSVNLKDKVDKLKSQRDDIKRQQTEKKKVAVIDEEKWDNSLYRTLPILPSMDEICSSAPPPIRSNKITEAYTGWEHYYDVQFRLLREDFIAPLRRGVSMFCSAERTGRLTDINVYNDVKLIQPEFTENGICYMVQFDISRFRQRKTWAHSKRLIFGSLLCFSPKWDNFKEEVCFATVIDRKPEELCQGKFHVQFEEGLDMFQHIQKTVFTVLESRAYFEASRHILHSLQTAEIDTMPFSRYLIKNQPFPVNAPRYLENPIPNYMYDIRWLYPKEILMPSYHCCDSPDFKRCSKRIDITKEWPTENEVELDKSQIEAIKMALTQEISVIQGPPGTGKTYIGYKIVQTLLQNRDIYDQTEDCSPILVMCYTNHALDQFLQGIIHHQVCRKSVDEPPNIVRIGSRSKNEEIQKCSLFKARGRYVPGYVLREGRESKEAIVEIASKIPWESMQKVMQNPINEFIVGPKGILKLRPGIHPTHFYQLTLLAAECNGKFELSLEYWLDFWTNEALKPVDAPVAVATEDKLNEVEISNAVAEVALDGGNGVEEEMIQVTGEAEIEEANRRLDNDSYQRFQLKEDKEETGEIFDGFNEHIQQQKLHNQPSDQPKTFQYIRKNQAEVNRILREIRNCDPLEQEDEQEIENITYLSKFDRYRLLRLWVNKYKERLGDVSQAISNLFERKCREHKLAQQEIDRIALERADVIGMTTTGAAKYQHILHLVKPKIVIVEEAAEVLESHIVSALNAGTQHLILIGDHKQLRPKPNEYELAKKHNLEVSLFERLIRNGLPHATLLIQHRMRPQIASLVCPTIYKTLINHESVKKYDNVKSCDKNMYFFHHTHPETEIEHLLSHSNDGEAELVVSLCRHFLKQGYNPSQITILTAYTGQLLCIREKMPKKDFEGVQVTNVDNFQGEENDIIILSLVRNNDLRKVGFLKEDNRVCVALSRAKMGFYCFGNFEMLRSVVPIWEVILKHVEEEECFGCAIPLHCHNHPDFKVAIKQANEFAIYFPEGGCQKCCTYRLDCGHQCKRYCHVTDANHKEYKCQDQCPKLCANGLHPCRAHCYQECPPCFAEVKKVIPDCGHEQTMMCYQHPQEVNCVSPCPKRCKNNLHDCPRRCSEVCTKCVVIVNRTIPKCGHQLDLPCYEDPLSVNCYYPCQKKCTAGLHDCPKECWEECGNCQTLVKKIIPKCGHMHSMYCYKDPNEFLCHKKCGTVYETCGHSCLKVCYEECDSLCQKPVEKIIPKCSHKDLMPCHKNPETAICTHLCERMKSCGHICKGQCGRLCSIYICTEPRSLKLPCTHEIIVPCNEYLEDDRNNLLQRGTSNCDKPCLKKLPCGHQCKNKCKDSCSTKLCRVKVPYTCPKGAHTMKLQCHQLQSPPLCLELCSQKLDCGHQCKKKCNEECSEHCNVSVTKDCHCGHRHSFKCGDTTNCMCKEKCTAVLQCGHKCSGMCGDCFTNRIHTPCIFQLQVNRFCGHSASLPCIGLLDQCEKPCLLSACPHNDKNCDHKCCDDCPAEKCHQKCCVECPHDKCSRECNDICDKPSCKEPCTKTLKCGHHCSGTCGGKCLPYCMKCNPKKFRDKVKGLGKNFKGGPNPPTCLQLDCGHVYTVKNLDQRFTPKPGCDQLISPLSCPTCSKPFISVYYWKISRSILEDIKVIKRRMTIINDRGDLSGFDCVRYNVEDMLVVRKVMTKHEFLSKRDPEGLCALKLLDSARDLKVEIASLYLPESDQLIKHIEKFVKVVIEIFRKTKGKLSLQLICDIESELFRLSLLGFQRIVSIGFSKTEKASSIQPLHDQLQLMEVNHNARLNFQRYREIFESTSRVCSLRGLTLIQPQVIPQITKGNWYKCTQAGHIYFVPAKYGSSPPSCTDCRVKKLDQ